MVRLNSRLTPPPFFYLPTNLVSYLQVTTEAPTTSTMPVGVASATPFCQIFVSLFVYFQSERTYVRSVNFWLIVLIFFRLFLFQ